MSDEIFIGMAFGIIPSSIFVIINYFYEKRDKILSHPIIVSILFNFFISTIFIMYTVTNSTGEYGLVAIGIAPFLIMGFLADGFFVGLCISGKNKKQT